MVAMICVPAKSRLWKKLCGSCFFCGGKGMSGYESGFGGPAPTVTAASESVRLVLPRSAQLPLGAGSGSLFNFFSSEELGSAGGRGSQQADP